MNETRNKPTTGRQSLLFPISGTGSFICPVAQTRLDIPRHLITQSWDGHWGKAEMFSSDNASAHSSTRQPTEPARLPQFYMKITMWLFVVNFNHTGVKSLIFHRGLSVEIFPHCEPVRVYLYTSKTVSLFVVLLWQHRRKRFACASLPA